MFIVYISLLFIVYISLLFLEISLFNFGFVLFTANDYESPNVFLFELENERNDWIFFIKHSILVAKYDLTVNHAKVYMFLEDNNLEK